MAVQAVVVVFTEPKEGQFDKNTGGVETVNTKHLENWAVTASKELFNQIDADGSGTLDREEISSICTALGAPDCPVLLRTPSPFGRCVNSDGESAPAKWQNSRQWLLLPVFMTPPHNTDYPPNKMAPITSGCGKTRSPSIKWP